MALIDEKGRVCFGIHNEPVGPIDYLSYPLKTPMGRERSVLARKIGFKQFIFAGIISPEFVSGMAVIDLKYIKSGFLYLYNRKTRDFIEKETVFPPFMGKAKIEPNPDLLDARLKSLPLSIRFEKQQIIARSKNLAIDMRMDFTGIKPMRIATRAGYAGWTFTQKSAPIPVSGSVMCNGRTIECDPDGCFAFIDWSAGYMRKETFWNWAASSCLANGKPFGLNLSCGVNETSFTENCFWYDGIMTRTDTVSFLFDPDHPEKPWSIHSQDGKVDLVFTPETHRKQKINLGIIASRFIQHIGTFSGTIIPDGSGPVKISGCPGWAEDHFAKW